MKEYEFNEMIFYRKYIESQGKNNSAECETIKKILLRIMEDTCTEKQLLVVSMALEGNKQIEIAQKLGINKSTVSKTYRRGINNIKECAKYLEVFFCQNNGPKE